MDFGGGGGCWVFRKSKCKVCGKYDLEDFFLNFDPKVGLCWRELLDFHGYAFHDITIGDYD